MRRIILYGNRLWFGASVLIAFVALIYLLLNLFFGQGSGHPIYWLAFTSRTDDLMWSLLCGSGIVTWGMFTFLAVLSFPFKAAKPFAHIGAKAALTTFAAGILMFGAYCVRFFQSGPLAYGQTVDNVTLNAHTYHLLLYAGDWDESWSRYYHLYECDGLDLFCTELTILPQSTGGIAPDVQEIHLLADTNSNTVSINANGAVTFTYHPN